MATYDNQLCITREAGADLSSNQYFFVSVSADGQVDATGDGAYAIGVLQNKPAAAGRAAEIAVAGITKVICGGTVTRGGAVASDSAGEAVNAAANDVILGEALETGADGSIISILLAPRGQLYGPTAHIVPLTAGVDLSSSQYFFVSMSADGQVDPTGDGAYAVGVLQNTPSAAGQVANVAVGGLTSVIAGGTVTAGDQIASDAAGECVTAASGDIILGEAVTGGADGATITILFAPRGTAP